MVEILIADGQPTIVRGILPAWERALELPTLTEVVENLGTESSYMLVSELSVAETTGLENVHVIFED